MRMHDYAKDKNPTICKKHEEDTDARIVCIPIDYTIGYH